MMTKHFVTSRQAELVLSVWVTNVMVAVHFGLGLSIIAGGKSRFSLPTYQPLIEMTNGHIWIWGVAILAAGTLMTTPYKWPNALGLFIGMAWMNVWAALFAVSVVQHADSAATPMVVYLGFALVNTALLTARFVNHDDPKG